jgi:hypothetical protein
VTWTSPSLLRPGGRSSTGTAQVRRPLERMRAKRTRRGQAPFISADQSTTAPTEIGLGADVTVTVSCRSSSNYCPYRLIMVNVHEEWGSNVEESEFENGRDANVNGAGRLVPLDVEGQRVYVWAQELPQTAGAADRPEDEVAWRPPTLEQALDGLMGVTRAMAVRLKQSDAEKVSVEFACEFALESGSFVAVIGKASGRSTFKVALEWTKPAG